MKKIFYLLLCPLVLLFQNCKKGSSSSDSSTTTYVLSATINGASWTPDTLSATITYNAATKTKVLNVTGTYLHKQLNLAITQGSATATNDFPLGSYTVDATGNPLMVYSGQQKDSNGNLAFVPVATAAKGEGVFSITAVNASTGTITGTFSMSVVRDNYDTNGNLVSITNTSVSAGTITAMPYKFVNQ